ncbi:urea carboxylase-associated family protein [Pseudonocardia sp. DSM 110487]|uniref:DUF1989 domain-containing protein n=1 Tax=Pseudonocardia sp. DSM 110487 TaxID=2865833 RepID=UPI001C69DE1C|nr:urea carboxylase-associated family protein [Pseudonocardia sp. DSM 110487]QYN34215.1 urea carboxylase-associated family protein [Pseudonocardia sp. DSM 110487]
MQTDTITRRFEVPGGAGRAVRVRAGELVRIVDLAGGQVGDVFAFATDVPDEHHSAAHTRTHTRRLFPALGEQFVTDRRRPILTLVADTSPGQHDMLIAACDPPRYAQLGAPDHRSCATNMWEALAAVGHPYAGPTPQPINVFMRIPVGADGSLTWLSAPTSAGDAITFRAELDAVVVVSSCPMDLVGINRGAPSPLAVEVLAGQGRRS